MTELERRANEMRADIVRMIAEAGSGHPGGSLSCADILTALYFGGVMEHDPANPQWEGRDRFVLAKGHAAPALYAALAHAGYFPREELMTLRKLGSRLQGHPDSNQVPGWRCPPARLARAFRGGGHGGGPCARREATDGVRAARRRRVPGGPGVGGRHVRGAPGAGQPRGRGGSQLPADRRQHGRRVRSGRHRAEARRVRLGRARGGRPRHSGARGGAFGSEGRPWRQAPRHRRPHGEGQGRVVHGEPGGVARQGPNAEQTQTALADLAALSGEGE